MEVGRTKVQGENAMATVGETGWTAAPEHAPETPPPTIHSQGEKAKGLQTEGRKEPGYPCETYYSRRAGFLVGLRGFPFLVEQTWISLLCDIIVMFGRLAHKVYRCSKNNVVLESWLS